MNIAVRTPDMYRQVFVPDRQNNTVSIPSKLYGRRIEVIFLPVLTAGTPPRKNWAAAARQMHLAGDDTLQIPTALKNENNDWWQWDE
jgi:hypothetical protein